MDNIEQASRTLIEICRIMESIFHYSTIDKLEIEQASEVITPVEVISIIDEPHESIEKHMRAFIPWPKDVKNHKATLFEWPERARLLQVIKRLHKSKKRCKDVIKRLNKQWETAITRLI